MNEQDFILLVEEYLDGTITDDGRIALRREISTDSERRRHFEQQARQHVRLHAQTSRCDFTESQRVANMVVEIVHENHERPHLNDYLRDLSFRERFRAMIDGFRAPSGSPRRLQARALLGRIIGAPAVSLAVNLLIIGMIVYFAVPRSPDPREIELPPVDFKRIESPPSLDPQPAPARQETDSRTESGGNDLVALNVTFLPPSTSEAGGAAGIPDDAGGPVIALPPGPLGPPNPNPIPLPPTISGRTNRPPRGAPEDPGEDAVTRALTWLKARQREDGSWDGQDKSAMTGLALLAYLGRGETPRSPVYGTTIRKGLDYLLRVQDSQGRYSSNVYAHAIATYAVAEAVTMTRVLVLRESMEKAVAIILKGQQAGGGFDYDYKQALRFDTSVTGWQLQALKAAQLALPSAPEIDAALDKCATFLRTQAFARDGSGFVYSGNVGDVPAGGATPSMTAVGTLGLQFLHQGRTPEARAGLKALADARCDWPLQGKAPVYTLYYLTQVKFQQENQAVWHAWDNQCKKTLLARQHRDGHWEGGDYDQGSHVYTTALCTLTLEVYYRYLPTYTKTPASTSAAPANEEGVPIDVR